MLCQNCQIDQCATTVADWSMPYGWPCIDEKSVMVTLLMGHIGMGNVTYTSLY